MNILRFGQFIQINESREEIKRLADLGLVNQEELPILLRKAGQEDYLATADSLNAEMVKAALETEGAKKLIAKGLYHSSSASQLKNGNMVFSVDPKYHSAEGWGIGFFTTPRIVKRMTPKQIPGLVWRRDKGSMDIPVRKFSKQGSNLEFLDKAMAWAADHIDFDQARSFPENPKLSRYYVNKRSKRDL